MKKKIIAGIVIAVLIAAGIVAAVIMKSPSKEASESEIQASAGQKIVYATIDAIAGNDIEVSLLDEDMVKQFSSMGRAEEDGEAPEREGFGGGDMPDMEGGMPDMSGGFPGGDFPGGAGGFGGGMPDMSGSGFPGGSGGGFGGGMPDMGGSASGDAKGDSEGGMPDMSGGGFPGGDFPGEMPEGFDGQMPPFDQEAEEKKASYRIPVGTDVITTLGATTTFSHLEEGDTIAILMEENSDAILKIWMIM